MENENGLEVVLLFSSSSRVYTVNLHIFFSTKNVYLFAFLNVINFLMNAVVITFYQRWEHKVFQP